jgi:hypothetical protein
MVRFFAGRGGGEGKTCHDGFPVGEGSEHYANFGVGRRGFSGFFSGSVGMPGIFWRAWERWWMRPPQCMASRARGRGWIDIFMDDYTRGGRRTSGTAESQHQGTRTPSKGQHRGYRGTEAHRDGGTQTNSRRVTIGSHPYRGNGRGLCRASAPRESGGPTGTATINQGTGRSVLAWTRCPAGDIVRVGRPGAVLGQPLRPGKA